MRRKQQGEKHRFGSVDRIRLKTGGILAALIAAVTVFTVMVQAEKKVLTGYEKGIIYTAAKMIPRGTLITEENQGFYLEEQELDKSCIPVSALSDPNRIRGLAAVCDIDCGAMLTGGMFEELNLILKEMEEPVIAGFKAEDIFQVAGGVLRAGDRIHIYSVSGENETTLIWGNVYVQGVFDQAGNQIGGEDTLTAAQRINVYLDNSDVPHFYSELAGGSLRAVKVVP